MTVALLLAAAPDRLSAMAQPYRQPGDRMPGAPPWLEFVGGRLMSAGVRQVDVAMCADAADGLRAVAATVRDIGEPVLVCTTSRALATPGGALAALAGGDGTATTALTAAGALLVASKDLPAVADAAEALAARIGSAGSAGGRVRVRGLLRRTRVGGDLNGALDSLIESIGGSGVHVKTVSYQEPGVNGRAAPVPGTVNGVRPSRRGGEPGLLATYACGPLASRIARWAAARTLAQTALATAAFALSVCAAAWYAHGTRSSLITGSVLLAVALPLRQAAAVSPSPLADWLAAVPGTAAEYAVYAALAASWTTARPHQAWVFATTAMVLLAVRQMTGACYLSVAGISPPVSGSGHRLLRLTGQSIAFPLAERTVLIAVTMPVWGPRTALILLIGWGVVALGYSLAERVIGSRSLASARPGAATAARPRGAVHDDGIG
ncbi:MAG TPA: hypothetical protein VKS82_26055 [Streptosporangiaceae bacterium]|nr:hypothetical protein [Streptosporangiaceae bacterium]